MSPDDDQPKTEPIDPDADLGDAEAEDDPELKDPEDDEPTR